MPPLSAPSYRTSRPIPLDSHAQYGHYVLAYSRTGHPAIPCISGSSISYEYTTLSRRLLPLLIVVIGAAVPVLAICSPIGTVPVVASALVSRDLWQMRADGSAAIETSDPWLATARVSGVARDPVGSVGEARARVSGTELRGAAPEAVGRGRNEKVGDHLYRRGRANGGHDQFRSTGDAPSSATSATTAVSEPATLGLMAIGVLGLGLFLHRKHSH